MTEQSDVRFGQWTNPTIRARARRLARLALWATVTLGAGSCDMMAVPESGADTDRYGALRGRTFLSESITENGTPKDLVEGTRISLQFTQGSIEYPGGGWCLCAPDRTLFAHAGCNFIQSNVTVRADRLEFGGVHIATEMGCGPGGHEQDDWLVGFLAASPAWTLADARLAVVSDGTEIVLLDREVANPDRPLAGTTWIVDTIVTGATVSSMHASTEGKAWLRIDGDTFRASSGCRDIEGNVTVDGDDLRLSATVQTEAACTSELELVDDVVLTILDGDVEFDIEADRLQLRHASGAGLGLHADE